jgi:hypothetical protein
MNLLLAKVGVYVPQSPYLYQNAHVPGTDTFPERSTFLWVQ